MFVVTNIYMYFYIILNVSSCQHLKITNYYIITVINVCDYKHLNFIYLCMKVRIKITKYIL